MIHEELVNIYAKYWRYREFESQGIIKIADAENEAMNEKGSQKRLQFRIHNRTEKIKNVSSYQ